MARRARQVTADEDGGAPEWMVTFSDCMTLLLTFFVLLLSFSSFDDKVFPKMQSAFSEGLASMGLQYHRDDNALQSIPRIVLTERQEVGSETPTPDGQYQSNPSTSMDFMNFENQKVFLVPSDKVFLGLGTRMSRHGQQMLTDVGELLKAVPNRVVITEHALDSTGAGGNIGLTRAWIVTQFLTDSRGLEKTRFSISSAGTTNSDTLRQSGVLASNPNAKRVLEIVILERSTYN
jgi:chemotaxis protein MotB